MTKWTLSEPQDDGLLIPEVPEHSADKHYFLTRYLNAFTTAMRQKQWRELNYIDLFAGAGIERLKQSEKLSWGSPMIAAQTPHSFSSLYLCERHTGKYSALKQRVLARAPDACIVNGDANEVVESIMSRILSGTLSVAFLDPYGLHLDYNTLVCLSHRRADLIIFFPDHLDALRNWEAYYLDNPESNLDRCLGPGTDWRELIDACTPQRRAQKLRELYVEQIGKLGYTEFEYERISLQGGQPLYCLIFCSKHEAGGRIWRRVSSNKPDGQRTFDWGDS